MHLEDQYPFEGRYKYPQLKEIAWGHILANNPGRITTIPPWKDFLENRIQPSLDEAFELFNKEQAAVGWSVKYRVSLNKLFERYGWLVDKNCSYNSTELSERIDQLCPELQGLSLAQKALRVSRSIGFTVVGMRTEDYVADVVQELQFPTLSINTVENIITGLMQK